MKLRHLLWLVAILITFRCLMAKHIDRPLPSKVIKVSYEITYDHVYTGDQSASIYTGQKEYEATPNNIGENGLPAQAYFPNHMNLVFNRWNGEYAFLSIPTVASRVTSLLVTSASLGGCLMTTEIDTLDGVFMIRAYPKLERS